MTSASHALVRSFDSSRPKASLIVPKRPRCPALPTFTSVRADVGVSNLGCRPYDTLIMPTAYDPYCQAPGTLRREACRNRPFVGRRLTVDPGQRRLRTTATQLRCPGL
jgi:hypothetical protein